MKEYPLREMLDRGRQATGAAAAGRRPRRRGSTAAAGAGRRDGGHADRRLAVYPRDAQGEPTGVLIDNAVWLVTAAIPRRTNPRCVAACAWPPRTAWPGRDFGARRGHCVLGARAVDEGAGRRRRLPGVRVHAMYDDGGRHAGRGPADRTLVQRRRHAPLRAVKLYADGALGAAGALLLGDDGDQPATAAWRSPTPATCARSCARWATPVQVRTHAIGDGGKLRLVLDPHQRCWGELKPRDALALRARADPGPRRHPRFAKLGVIAAMAGALHLGHGLDRRAAGRRAPEETPTPGSLLKTGAHLSSRHRLPPSRRSSRWKGCTLRVRACTRTAPIGGWRPEEAVDARTALWLYTAGGAWAAFAEGRASVIAPGYRADLVVLDGDPVGGEAKGAAGDGGDGDGDRGEGVVAEGGSSRAYTRETLPLRTGAANSNARRSYLFHDRQTDHNSPMSGNSRSTVSRSLSSRSARGRPCVCVPTSSLPWRFRTAATRPPSHGSSWPATVRRQTGPNGPCSQAKSGWARSSQAPGSQGPVAAARPSRARASPRFAARFSSPSGASSTTSRSRRPDSRAARRPSIPSRS
ncbi:MAG: amidohydrolase family protein [Betaproteobacteria bacterium]|nr:amidohydrolase family protein [Betaproteobacteria bacterium]